VLAPFGISAEQGHVLLVLWFEGARRIGELQRVLTLSSGTLTGAIDRMEREGLVKRSTDATDGRSFVVEAGEMDSARRRSIEEAIDGIESRCFAALTARERRELLRLLEKVALPDDITG
jgi:DNA-binding MarR family transcriptional regulator